MTDRLLWKPREAALALGISERTLWQLKRDNLIPFVQLGRSVRYPVDRLREWINQRESSTSGEPQ